MHIGIDARLTYYRTGGISTYIRRLIGALEKLDSSQRYTIFQSRKMHERLTTRFETAAVWTPCHHRWERLALSVELARHRLDVLHSPDFIPPVRGARRHVITVHDLTFLRYPQFVTADSRRYYNDQIETAVRQADHILADSQATKTDLVTLLGAEASKITVHMLGVEERFRPLPAEEAAAGGRALGLPARFILFVGTIEPRKNIIGLAEAYRRLRARLPDTPPLLLVGRRGWFFEETLAQIQGLGLEEHIIWREDISDEALPVVYNLAKVVALPSFYEGFGFPPLEGMACGSVPIVSNRSSLPEVVGDVGLQVDPDDPDALADGLYRALTDEAWWTGMRRAGLERAQLFRWEQTAATVLSVYRQLS